MNAAARRTAGDDALAHAAAALVEIGRRSPDALAVVSVPAPAIEPWLWPEAELIWAPPTGAAIAGLGPAVELGASGEGRFAAIRDGAARWLARLVERRHPATTAPPPRFYGGFGFAPGEPAGGWAGHGDARFVLPRVVVGVSAGRGFLQLACPAPGDPTARGAALAEVERALAQIERPLVARSPIGGRLEPDDPRDFLARVAAIRAAVADGRVQKVVAARAAVVELAGALVPGAALAALAARFPDCFRFAFAAAPGPGAAVFLGASPELLIRRRGELIESESLAGTAPRAGDAAGLLRSSKDRGEQAVVTEAIVAALAPLCGTLDLPRAPEVRELGHVRHLRTPIRGRLREPRHVLELGALLHPTPAVGGAPRAAALDFIARHEPARGWYAGCVGWFDGEGDGELAVAIRSALVTGRRALVYAGAGIVAGSNPAAEYDETRMKLSAMLGALGVAAEVV